jgi:hypothetical protein
MKRLNSARANTHRYTQISDLQTAGQAGIGNHDGHIG